MNIQILDSWLKEYLITKARPKNISKYVSLCGPTFDRTNKYEKGWLYDIEVTTNRVDAMSVYGIAREAAAILPQFGIKARLKSPRVHAISNKKDLGIKIVNDKKLCHRILAGKLENAHLEKSSDLINKRLLASGQRPLNNAIDVTNYVMWEIGHPVHVFDYDKVGKIILVREAKKGEVITTLDNKQYKLNGGEVVFDNGRGEIIDLPGIMGTANSVVTHATKNLLLWIESVDPIRIRNASMGLNIRSQAAILNEKAVDPELGLTAILKACSMMQKETGASVASKLIDIYPQPKKTKILKTNLSFIQNVLGVKITKAHVAKILSSLAFDPKWNNDQLKVSIPSFRSNDISIPEDIVEEVARIYGYHKLPSIIMDGEIPTASYDSPFEFESKIKGILSASGGNEAYTYSLVPKQWVAHNALKLKNPLGLDTQYLRTTLLHSLIEATRKNKHENDPFHLFEVSNVYKPKKNDLPTEKMMLSGIFSGYEYRDAKGVIEILLSRINVDVSYVIVDKENFKPGQYVDIRTKKNRLGGFGVLENELIYYDFDVEKLRKQSKLFSAYKPIPKYPAQVEDLTLIIPERTKVGDLVHFIESVNSMISDVELTDIYQDSYTFRIYYLNPDKTLTDREVAKIRGKVVRQLKKKFGVRLKD